VLALAGCVTHGTAGPPVVGPNAQPSPDRPDGLAEGDSATELDARKDKLMEQLRSMRAVASTDPETCEGLCSLATSICGVAEKLCNIADEHTGEDDYQALCREAKRECHEAQQDCVACVEGLARTGPAGTCAGEAQPASGQSNPSTK
jgi:hypothetical protein